MPLLYLIGLAAGTLAYFSGLVADFDVAVGVCLACAAEFHSYLVQRRMRMARARLNRAKVGDAEYGALESQYTRQRNILIALLAFSAYNSVQFVASTWTPTGWLPGPLQIAIRGLVVPGLFYLAGELTPVITEPADVLAHASREMTFAAVRTVSRQWTRRLRRARRRNLDLAPIAVTLMHDAGDYPGADRIRVIAAGLTAAEEGRMPELPAPHASATPQLAAPAITDRAEIALTQLTNERPTDRPPTGPGSPTLAPVRTDELAPSSQVVELRPTIRQRPARRAAAQGRSGGTNTQRVRTRRSAGKESVEAQARAVWKPGMTVTELQRKAGISRNAAASYRRQFIAETQEPQRPDQIAQ